jgi:hypothetical protein
MYPSDEFFLFIIVKPILFCCAISAVFALGLSVWQVKLSPARHLLARGKQRGQTLAVRVLVNFTKAMGYSLPIALLGFVAGYLTGTNQVPLIGNIMQAILTVAGGLQIYLVGQKSRERAFLGFAISSFAVLLFYGAFLGSVEQGLSNEARLASLSEQELRIRNLRQNLGLPVDFPPWVSGQEKK